MAGADKSEAADAEAIWRQAAERALGQNLEALESLTAEGLTIQPLYSRRTMDPLQPWHEDAGWSVAQRIDHPDAEAANRLALLDLEGGADALVLVGAESPSARGFGLRLAADTIDVVFDRVELDFISLRLDVGPETFDALTSLAGLVERRHLASAALAVDIGFDPIGWRVRFGRPCDADPRRLLDLRAQAGLGGTLFLADGRPYHEAGTGEAQELAAVLATAVAYLRQAEALGVSLDVARKSIALLLAADADLFLGLAKFRAMRRLWTRVETVCGLTPAPVRLHAETSWRMMTRYDPWTNVMRGTAATFAAGLGGADCITVLPFTAARGLPDEAARRLARNTQRVLLDEAHLGKVADPTAGAGSFEALTEALAAQAWRLFQEIEDEGGIARSIDDGRIQARIAETAAARSRDLGHLARGIVGTSRFASLDVPPIDVLDIAPRPAPEAGPDALPVLRDATPFEALRDRAERSVSAGNRPRVFLATLGTPAAFGPRATYAANFFAAAGLAAQPDTRERDIGDLVAAFAESGTAVACLCGTDAAYEEASVRAAKTLRAAGAQRILLVGRRPGEQTQIGVDDFIHEGCDALSILESVLDVTSKQTET